MRQASYSLGNFLQERLNYKIGVETEVLNKNNERLLLRTSFENTNLIKFRFRFWKNL